MLFEKRNLYGQQETGSSRYALSLMIKVGLGLPFNSKGNQVLLHVLSFQTNMKGEIKRLSKI